MIVSRASLEDLEEVFQLYRRCKTHLDEQGIFQWTDAYPGKEQLLQDLKEGTLWKVANESRIRGVIVLNQQQEEQYQQISWTASDRALIVHRLAIHPNDQGKGLAKSFMHFAEDQAKEHLFESIRLDAYSGNPLLQKFYSALGYSCRGQIYFPARNLPFDCFEKVVI